MRSKGSADTFRALAGRVGMCPAAALLEPTADAVEGLSTESKSPLRSQSFGGDGWELPKRQLLECICEGASVGGQSLLECLLRARWETGVFNAFIDAASSLDPATLQEDLGERLLWVQVRGPQQLMRALDLLLRDDNFALVAADLRGLPSAQLQAIQPFAWYRLQRLAHQRAGGCVIFSDTPSVRCADRRMRLSVPRTLQDLDRRRVDLLSALENSARSYNRVQIVDQALVG